MELTEEEIQVNILKLKSKIGDCQIGGKGTQRRKRKAVPKTSSAVGSVTKKIIQKFEAKPLQVEEVSFFKEDLSYLHFSGPEVFVGSNNSLFVVLGKPQVKDLRSSCSEVFDQLKPQQIKMLMPKQENNRKSKQQLRNIVEDIKSQEDYKEVKQSEFSKSQPIQFENKKIIPERKRQTNSQGEKKISYTVKVAPEQSQGSSVNSAGGQPEDIFEKSPKKVWETIEKLTESQPEIAAAVCEQVMNKPLSEVEKKESSQIETRLTQKAQQQTNSVENVIMTISSTLRQSGVTVNFSEKSSMKSQISLKCLTEGFMDGAIKCEDTLPDNDPGIPFTFDMIQEDEEALEAFQVWYRDKIHKEYGIARDKIKLLNITKGSIKVEWTCDEADLDSSKLSVDTNDEEPKRQIKLHPYFAEFQLSPEDFDPRGNIQFNDSVTNVMTRGGWPYYQPQKCKRYGLNVWGKYDGGCNNWLLMDGNPQQWAVAYHGVRAPQNFVQDTQKSTLASIIAGLKKGEMLKIGTAHACKDHFALNNPQKKVGLGIYCAPHIQITLSSSYTTPKKVTGKQQEYCLILQCRVNPKKINVCNNDVYWVINQSKDIRPYGIVLMKKDVRSNYRTPQTQFGETFSWRKYKSQVQSHRAKAQ